MSSTSKKQLPPPTLIQDFQEMQIVANEMLVAARKYPNDRKPVYSTTEAEVAERNKLREGETGDEEGSGYWLHDKGLAKTILIRMDGQPALISLTVTLEVFMTQSQFRLSMCYVTEQALAPVPEPVASIIAKAFFGDQAESAINPSGIEHAKHFIQRLNLDGSA